MPKVTRTVDPSVKLGAAARSVVRVGDGRGFIIEKNGERLIVTAAHCLTAPIACFDGYQPGDVAVLPPAIGNDPDNGKDKIYAALVGPLGAVLQVSVECRFADPLSDLAVLGAVDNQAFGKWADAYDQLVDPLDPLPLGSLTFTYRRHPPPPAVPLPPGFPASTAASDPVPRASKAWVDPIPTAESDAWLLALDRRWFRCRVRSRGRSLWISEAQAAITGGMSGSPVMLASGHAIGVVSMSGGADDDEGGREGNSPLLAADLPCWLAGGLLDIPPRGTP